MPAKEVAAACARPISVDRPESAPCKGNSRSGSEVLGAREIERSRKSSGSFSPAIKPQL